MAFITDGELKTYFAAQLRQSSGSTALAASFDVLVPVANRRAYNKILSKLLGRGYTKAVIDAWDDGPDFNRFLGTYYLYLSGASLQADDTWPEKFNIESELDDVIVLVGGEVADTVAADSDIRHGTMKYASDVAATFIGGDAE